MSQSVQVCLDSRERVFALATAMAGMVEGAVDHAITALLDGDYRLAHAVVQKETMINCMEMHIDAAVLEHLSKKDLPREDLRSMGAVLKINKDLERMGDLAANISRKVLELGESWEHCERAELQPMSIAVSHICRKTLRALLRRDVVLAESALSSEEAVRNYRDYVSRRIRERLANGSSHLASDLALFLASRSLEQISGHATNLAENLVFWLKGAPYPQLLAS